MEESESSATPQKSGRNPMLVTGIVVLVIIGGILLLSSKKANNQSTQTIQTQQTHIQAKSQPTSVMTQTMSNTSVQTVTIEGGNFYFKPNEIRVKKGQKVKITFSNVGNTMHAFVINEFNVKIDPIPGGQSATAEFTPDKSGTFEFYCSIPNHRQMGMKGNLIVQ
jgi:cytochrome c oxidase subunit 2